MTMQDIILILAVWMIVPGILLGIIWFARSIVYRTAEGEHRISVRAGHYAGFVAFATFVVWTIGEFSLPQFDNAKAIRISLPSFALAAAFGYFLVYLIRNLIPTRIGGLLVLLLVLAGSSSMYSYFFISEFNNAILSSTLGLAFGVLIHAVMSPRSIYEIFPEVHRDPFHHDE